MCLVPFWFLRPLRNAHEAHHLIRLGMQVRTHVGVDGVGRLMFWVAVMRLKYVVKAADDELIKGFPSILAARVYCTQSQRISVAMSIDE